MSGPEQCGVYLGDPCSQEPTAVQGGLQFTAIGHGSDHGCGLTPGGKAYCWGYNFDGRLGTGSAAGPEQCDSYGSPISCSTQPVAVTGSLSFTTLVVGLDHACGLVAGGAAYCWGANAYGQLGDSSRTDRMAPVPVAGGHSFVALSAGASFTCGRTSDSIAYCWGDNGLGQLGFLSTVGAVVTPDSVAGGHRFASISAGEYHTCGVTGSGAAYCWGQNYFGELGIGTTSDYSRTPVAVTGGLTFASVMAGGWHSCGVTVAGVAYCWGNNGRGELGNGSTTSSSVPVKVAGQP